MQYDSKSPKKIIDWSQIYEVMGWDKSYLHRMIAGETFNLTEIIPVHKVRFEDAINKKPSVSRQAPEDFDPTG